MFLKVRLPAQYFYTGDKFDDVMRLGMISPTEQLSSRVHIANNLISTSPVYIPVLVSIPVEIIQTYLLNICVHACRSYRI